MSDDFKKIVMLGQPQNPQPQTKTKRRKRRRLLCFDLLEDTVAWWSLETVCRLTFDVGNWTLLRACSFNRAYKLAQKPHLAGNLLFTSSLSLSPFLVELPCEAPQKQLGGCGNGEKKKRLPAMPSEIPPLPNPSIIVGFRDIFIAYGKCDYWLRKWSLSLFAEKAAPLFANHRLILRKEILPGPGGVPWFCSQFARALYDGGFRPLSIMLMDFHSLRSIRSILRHPHVRDCPALEAFCIRYSPELIEWLHRPLSSSTTEGQRTMLVTSRLFHSMSIDALKTEFISAHGPADGRPYTVVYSTMFRAGAPFRIENPMSGESLVFEKLTQDLFRSGDLSPNWVRDMCGKAWVLRRGCLVGPQPWLNLSYFYSDHKIELTI